MDLFLHWKCHLSLRLRARVRLRLGSKWSKKLLLPLTAHWAFRPRDWMYGAAWWEWAAHPPVKGWLKLGRFTP